MVVGVESRGEARWWPASKAKGRRDGGDEYYGGDDGRLADLRRLTSIEDGALEMGGKENSITLLLGLWTVLLELWAVLPELWTVDCATKREKWTVHTEKKHAIASVI
ncbi:hypothetical protein LR48_Vigan11g128300 [Vigna angularis]|uniref:Uncharacterized protein n=1 Tax=Phaseolus angularis TaxID=3914 RepID=A0A0L9VU06_PHAAN|nr:hypothetical protein LR48_Vigan11g128300 [Vigna angularis]